MGWPACCWLPGWPRRRSRRGWKPAPPALNDLGLVQQQTGDYPAAAASHQQALTLFSDLGNLLG